MRAAIVFLLGLMLLLQAGSASAHHHGFSNREMLLEWLYSYRTKPAPKELPNAVRAMKRLGLFRNQEKTDFFIGFIAGIFAHNPDMATGLAEKMFPLPPKEQAVIIKAFAYSGMPGWQEKLQKISSRMPYRQALIESYVFGEEPGLMDLPLESGPSTLYALWGYYVATGEYEAVARIIPALRWAKGSPDEQKSTFMTRVRAAFTWSDGDDDADKATIGGTAKWTLVSHAERDRSLVAIYKVQLAYQSEAVAPRLREVIEAAEKFESERVRREELAAIEKIRRDNPEGAGFNRAASFGSVAIATGCVAASAAGLPQIGVPCIVSGAVYSGVVKLLR